MAAFMWLVAVCVGVSQQKDSDRSVLISSSAIAFALTLNIDPLYLSIDTVLGSSNWLELVSDVALMVGISFLLRAIFRSTRDSTHSFTDFLAMVALVAVCIAIAVTFTQIDARPTSTSFMHDFGNQMPAAVYSIIQFGYVGAAMIVMAWVAIRHSGELPSRIGRTSLRVVCAGCVAAAVLSATVIGMDITHLMNALPLFDALSVAYEPLYITAIVLLCVGFSAPPVARRLGVVRRDRRTKSLVTRLTPGWSTRVDQSHAIPVSHYGHGTVDAETDSLELQLHRMIVELRDAATKTKTPLSIEISSVLVAAESHLAIFGASDTAVGGRR